MKDRQYVDDGVPRLYSDMAIDFSGLKCYGQDEWMQEKYSEISEKREWCKLHVSIDQYNVIQTSELTHRRIHDVAVVHPLMESLPKMCLK